MTNDSLNHSTQCPMCQREAEASYYQGWNRTIACHGCGFSDTHGILGAPLGYSEPDTAPDAGLIEKLEALKVPTDKLAQLEGLGCIIPLASNAAIDSCIAIIRSHTTTTHDEE